MKNIKILGAGISGFQDMFFGFGMKYAFLSGYFAAKSIINKTSYDKLWKKSFENELKKTMCIRFVLNIFGDRLYEKIINYLNSKRKYEILYQISRIVKRW